MINIKNIFRDFLNKKIIENNNEELNNIDDEKKIKQLEFEQHSIKENEKLELFKIKDTKGFEIIKNILADGLCEISNIITICDVNNLLENRGKLLAYKDIINQINIKLNYEFKKNNINNQSSLLDEIKEAYAREDFKNEN
jgi:hypothetical protein